MRASTSSPADLSQRMAKTTTSMQTLRWVVHIWFFLSFFFFRFLKKNCWFNGSSRFRVRERKVRKCVEAHANRDGAWSNRASREFIFVSSPWKKNLGNIWFRKTRSKGKFSCFVIVSERVMKREHYRLRLPREEKKAQRPKKSVGTKKIIIWPS